MLWTESNQLFGQPSISLAWAPAQVTVTDGSLSVSPAVLGLSCCVLASHCGGFSYGAWALGAAGIGSCGVWDHWQVDS